MKRIAFYILLVVTIAWMNPLQALNVYSVRDGAWMDTLTWGGTLPDQSEDSIIIAHAVTIGENMTITGFGRLTILAPGSLSETGNRTLQLDAGTVLVCHGRISLFMIKNEGTIFLTGLIDLEGDLINHNGVIYNDGMLYAKNLLNQSGMLSGDGGQFLIWNHLNTDDASISTCTGAPINICNPDGVTDPCNGPGFFDPECVTICGLALNLDLLAFEARPDPLKGTVDIMWVTARETGLAFFLVERMDLFSDEWTVISNQIAAKGDATDQTFGYQFVDVAPTPGNNMYRLAIRSIDGMTEYSFVVHAVVGYAGKVTVAPNPFTETLCMIGQIHALNTIELYNGFGEFVYSADGDIPECLYLPDLEDGWYVLRLRGDQIDMSVRVMKFGVDLPYW